MSRRGTASARNPGWRRIAAWTLAGGVIGAAALAGWRHVSWPDRVRAWIPPEVDLAGRPASLRDQLTAARARLGTRAELLSAVAALGRLYHANGYAREAAQCWEALTRFDPGEARWVYLRADLFRASGDYAAYEVALRRTVQLAPDCAPAWLHLAGLTFKSGRWAEAEQAYRRRLGLLPGDVYARLGLARLALRDGRRGEARAELETLAREAPDFPTVHNVLAEILAAEGDATRTTLHRWLGREKGRFREAPDPWLDELTAECFDAGRLRVLGTIQFQTNQGDRGRALFERAVELEPKDPATHEVLGELLLILNEPKSARESLQRARQLVEADGARGQSKLYATLAAAERASGDAAAALAVVSAGIEREGESAELLTARGDALAGLGRLDEAVAAYRAAVSRDPAAAETHQKVAVLLLDAGQRDAARRHLERALESQPTLPAVLRLLGRIELDAGEWESAGRRFRLLFESNPGVPLARQLLAEWHLRVGAERETRKDDAAALGHFRTAVELTPENPVAQERLGFRCLLSGQVGESLAPLEALHRLQPQNAQACLYLGQAYARLGRIAEARSVLAQGVQLAERAGNQATAGFCREILRSL